MVNKQFPHINFVEYFLLFLLTLHICEVSGERQRGGSEEGGSSDLFLAARSNKDPQHVFHLHTFEDLGAA